MAISHADKTMENHVRPDGSFSYFGSTTLFTLGSYNLDQEARSTSSTIMLPPGSCLTDVHRRDTLTTGALYMLLLTAFSLILSVKHVESWTGMGNLWIREQ